MFFLKACPKCRGDLVVESDGLDRWGEPADIICIQCGYNARPGEREALVAKMKAAIHRRRTDGPVSAERHRPVRAG